MSKERDIASICARLAELEAERSELNEQLERLKAQRGQEKVGGGDSLIAGLILTQGLPRGPRGADEPCAIAKPAGCDGNGS
jgi:hypothetical protein